MDTVNNSHEVRWTNYKGEAVPVWRLEDDHLWNILKYCLMLGGVPAMEVLLEASSRGFLHTIGAMIPAKDGFKSPEEVRYEVLKSRASAAETKSNVENI